MTSNRNSQKKLVMSNQSKDHLRGSAFGILKIAPKKGSLNQGYHASKSGCLPIIKKDWSNIFKDNIINS